MNKRLLFVSFVMASFFQFSYAASERPQVTILGKSFPDCGSFKCMGQIYWETLIATIKECQEFEAAFMVKNSDFEFDPLMVARDKYGFSALENDWLNAYRNLPHKGGPTAELREAALEDQEHTQLPYVKEAEKISAMFSLLKDIDVCEQAYSNHYKSVILTRYIDVDQSSVVAKEAKDLSPVSPAISAASAALSDSVTSVEGVMERSCSAPIPIPFKEKNEDDFYPNLGNISRRKLGW